MGLRRKVEGHLFGDRRLWYVLAAYVCSRSADGILPVAESFAILRLTGSPSDLGIVLACQGAATLIFSAAAGVAGDRFRHGRILIASTLARMVMALTVAVSLITGTASLLLLLIAATVYGCADAFFTPASRALLPEITSADKLGAVNAMIGGTSDTGWIIAPALAGAIVGFLGPGYGFAFEALVLTAGTACLVAAKLPRVRSGTRPRAHPLSELKAGWQEFVKARWLWLLTAQWTLFSLLILAPVAVLGPTIAERFLGGALAWGIISSCLAVGLIVGQIVAARVKPSHPALTASHLVPLMAFEALALGLGLPVEIVGAAAAITGIVMGLQDVLFQTTMQLNIPGDALARVSSIDLIGSELGQPAGYVIAGTLAAAVGPRTFLLVSCVGVVLGTTAFTFARPLRAPTYQPASPVAGNVPQ